MKIGYARVSTKDQTVDLQLDALKQAGCERIYQEVASGAKTARPELDRLLVHISEHSDHPFRDYTIADFAIIRSPIPRFSGHF